MPPFPLCRAAGLMSVLAAVLAPGSGCGAGLRALAVQQAAALSGDAAAAAEFAARGGVAGMMALVRCGAEAFVTGILLWKYGVSYRAGLK